MMMMMMTMVTTTSMEPFARHHQIINGEDDDINDDDGDDDEDDVNGDHARYSLGARRSHDKHGAVARGCNAHSELRQQEGTESASHTETKSLFEWMIPRGVMMMMVMVTTTMVVVVMEVMEKILIPIMMTAKQDYPIII